MKSINQILLVVTFFWNTLPIMGQSKPTPKDRYVGIEIGGGGVKLAIIDVRRELDSIRNLEFYKYDKIRDSSEKTGIVTFELDAIRKSAEVVRKFYKIAREDYKMPVERIHICVSYGVVTQALQKDSVAEDKDSRTLGTIQMEVLAKVPEYSKAKKGRINFLSERQEPYLTHVGIVRDSQRNRVALLDIGSANTKGGYFVDSINFVPFEFTVGTAALCKEGMTKVTNLRNFKSEYQAVVDKMVKNDYKQSIISATDNLRHKYIIVLSGGICWAVARITDPNDSKSFQTLTVKQVEAFTDTVLDDVKYELLEQNTGLQPVFKAFNRNQLIAGSILLKSILEWVERDSPEMYEFHVYKDSYVAWLKGFIIANRNSDNK